MSKKKADGNNSISSLGTRAMILALVLLILCVAMIFGWSRKLSSDIVLEINGEKVTTAEAMVYWKLMRQQYESIAGEEVWDLGMLGFDPGEEAVDRVIESIIRIKLTRSVSEMVKASDVPEILEKTDQLKELLGPKYMKENGIDRDLLEKVVRENYQAYLYEESANFRTSEFEEDIEKGLQEYFGAYDEMDLNHYLTKAAVIPLMIYTGQMTGGEWVEYSEQQKEALKEKADEIYEDLTYSNFYETARKKSDSLQIQDNPVFEYGEVLCQNGRNEVYLGQMLPEVAEKVAATPAGEMTEVMETEYGYLICLVTSFIQPNDQDLQTYDIQLLMKKAEYRGDLINMLKTQRMEEEWQRMEQEADIVRYRDNLIEYVLRSENP